MHDWLNWGVPLLIAVFGGLLWFLYRHPDEGRTLVSILVIVGIVITFIWAGYERGARKEYERLIKSHKEIKFPERVSDSSNIDLLFICTVGAYIILIGLYFLFADIKRKEKQSSSN